ncbi:MAG TPA: autotransporter-associated beta strand repeat-containing protein [Opitutaceae bacterium]
MSPPAYATLKSAVIGLGLTLGAASVSATTIVYDWSSSTTGNAIVNAASNWTGGSGSPQSSENAELRFGSAVTTSLVLNTNLDVSKLKFTGAFPSYTLGGSGSYGIDSGGILLESSGTGSVTISTAISLRASQTWTTNRPLTVSGVISPYSTSLVLTKNGAESLTLSGANTFDGGLTVSAGTLILGSNTGAGTGTLTLGNGTVLTSNGDARTITNHIHIEGSTVQFSTSSSSGDLVLSGSTEFQSSGTTTISGGGTRVQFGQLESENSNTLLVFTGDNAFVFGGSVASTITSITAGTTTTSGGVLFANSNAVHSGLTIAGGKAGSYVGVVDSAFTSTTHLGNFLSKIAKSTFAGTLGFDSPSTSSPLTYVGGTSNALNLSAFTGSNFEGLGSGTYAIIGSAAVITPPSGGALKLSGVRGGILKVEAPLSTGNSVTSVRINDNSADTSSGAVILSSASSDYTGGTLLKAGYLLFGASSSGSPGAVTTGPIGTGGLSFDSSGTGYLAATTSGLTLHNAIALGSEASSTLKVGISTSTPSTIAGLGNNTFTLAGVISGGGNTKVYIQNKDGAITLSGANTYTGTTDIASASLIAAAANALGSQAKVMFQGSSTLTVSTPTLSIGDLDSATSTSSTIVLGSNNLAIYQNNAGTYRGDITGSGSVSKHNSGDLTLANATNYTGGTTVHSGKVILASGATLGASTSTITLNNGASLIANSGATVSNPLTLNSGSSIGGAGTFATTIAVGSGVTLSPGSSPGTMTFSSGLTLNSGGTLAFEIRDANTGLNPGASTSWDLLSISGTLAVNASSASPFTIQVKSLNSDFASGNAANFNESTNYAWKFAGATSITGFEANAFTIDRSGFTNSSLGSFFVSRSGNDLLLNFTPVPEPETYVLMGAGLSLLAASALRRRKRTEKTP